MTCAEVIERARWLDPAPDLFALACDALVAAHDAWDSLPDGGDEVCAAGDLAAALWALGHSRKMTYGTLRLLVDALDAVRFRASPLWRSPRHAFRDDPASGRALYFALRDSAVRGGAR